MNQRTYRISFGGPLTPVVKSIIIINVCVFLFLRFAKNPQEILLYVGLVPVAVIKERFLWQPLSYMFVHVDFWHVLLNMLVLWWFGCDIERSFGSKYFLRYYLLTGVGAGVFTLLLSMNSPVPVIGASGAIFGLLLAFAILFPNRRIYIMFVLPVKAKWAVLAFATMEFLMVFDSRSTGVSHLTHIGGLLVGLVWFGYYLKILRIGTLRALFTGRKKNRPPLYVVKDADDVNDFFDNDTNGTVH